MNRSLSWNYNDRCISGDHKYYLEIVNQYDHWIKVDVITRTIYDQQDMEYIHHKL